MRRRSSRNPQYFQDVWRFFRPDGIAVPACGYRGEAANDDAEGLSLHDAKSESIIVSCGRFALQLRPGCYGAGTAQASITPCSRRQSGASSATAMKSMMRWAWVTPLPGCVSSTNRSWS